MSSPPVRHSDVDACPGALRLHAAADGPLARVRLPGGLLTGEQVRALAGLARRWGDGHLEITSRANVQLRALTRAPVAALAAALHEAGLLPSESHELVRNIAAAPVPAAWDTRPVVRELDVALCAEPGLAELPGRFLFAVGPVPAAADVTALPAPGGVAILFAGHDPGLRVRPEQVAPALVAAAHAFLAVRAEQGVAAWRLRELSDGPAEVARRTAAAIGAPLGTREAPPSRVPAEPLGVEPLGVVPLGVVPQGDGRWAAAAMAPLGLLAGERLVALTEAAQLAVTPWRGVVVLDQPRPAAEAWLARLAGAGFEVAPDSRWSGVTACAGRPGCARALADVRGDAAATTRFGEGLPVHWVGCARGCGSPAGAHVRVEATGTGYMVTTPHRDGGPAPATGTGEPATAAEVGGKGTAAEVGGKGTVAEVGELVSAVRRA